MTALNNLTNLFRRVSLCDDMAAYKELFVCYHHRLTKFSFSILHDFESAEEVVSDVFLKLWNGRKALADVQNPHLYLYVCTKNQSINYLRKRDGNRVFCIDEIAVELESLYLDPEQLMITEEMLKRIRLAIKQLPQKCQLVFKLIKEDGLKHKEAAELLGLSVKTIENQMTIALRKITHSIHFVAHHTQAS
jgi:RNA polymerase sigma-70 factor (family 1)